MSLWELVEKPSARELQEMAKIQEKGVGVGSLSFSTMFVNVDGALSSLSTSKDGSQVVVAGRNVFKVIGIEDSGFVEKTNLRVGRINLNFCITDVQWHPVDDHILATAAGNGAVILWNLNKITKQKQETVFSDHKRTVNRIQFHPYEKDLLLSGSQDGTMKYFDLRKQNVASTFNGRSDIIRDVQFNPFDGQTFAAACENGNIQLWDSRQPSSPIIQFMGHNGPTFAVDWHPEEKNWVASAGRDTMVKIWDVHAKTSLVNTIQTISPVGRIKWRPQRKFQIASCSLIVDFDIHVWDIRRPYLPYASFSEHKDAVTGILWRQSLRNKDPYVFFSCAKDSRLYQHVFSDAQHPADHAPRAGLSVSVNGDISVAFSDQLPKGFTTQSIIHTRPRSGHNPLLQNKFQDMADNVREVKSTLAVHSSEKSTKVFGTLAKSYRLSGHSFSDLCEYNCNVFVILAKSYRLSGHSFSDLCEYNCNVASKLLMHEHAQTWSVLKTLYSSTGGTGTTSTSYAISTVNPAIHASGTGNAEPAAIGVSLQSNLQGTMTVKSLSETGMAQNTVAEIQDVDDDLSSSNSEGGNPKFMNFASRDFPFREDQDEVPFFYDDSVALGDAPRDWTLPSEAFEPRAALDDRQTIPSLDQEAERPESPTSNVESESLSAINVKSLIDSSIVELQETYSSSNKSLSLPEWDFTSLVVEVLQHLADTGDVQMCVSALIVLGEKIRSRIDEQTQEQWIISYIDLLGRLQLWSVATQIIQLSSLPAISSLNQASTTVHTMCERCSKPLTTSGWYCERCRSVVAPCSLCHLMVKGPYVWCQGCGHGGHLKHMKEWFSNHIWCPAGCGHMCEYT